MTLKQNFNIFATAVLTYIIDSTTIDLCLSLFPWANFRKRKGAVKIHTLLNATESILEYIVVTDGKKHDL
ncbi:MAG: hypothetical protein DRH04_00280 [Deltaproteobacteria bacterium]|nr:MAG: hypothetical protein DRH04_00280 [Deltaproteobacteria bacterium]